MTPPSWLSAVNAANAARTAKVVDRIFQYLGAIHEVWKSVDKGMNNLYADYREGRKGAAPLQQGFNVQRPVQAPGRQMVPYQGPGSASDRAAFIRAVGRPPYSLDELEKFMWEDG